MPPTASTARASDQRPWLRARWNLAISPGADPTGRAAGAGSSMTASPQRRAHVVFPAALGPSATTIIGDSLVGGPRWRDRRANAHRRRRRCSRARWDLLDGPPVAVGIGE